MAKPLFSIITIAYQNLDGLRETVGSVQAQSFHDFEHIVIDGGSTDGGSAGGGLAGGGGGAADRSLNRAGLR